MPIGSKDLTVKDLEQKDNSALIEELKDAKKELFTLRLQSATGQLETHGRIKAVKRDIARIYTILKERELGLRPEISEASTIDSKSKKKRRLSSSKKTSNDAEEENK